MGLSAKGPRTPVLNPLPTEKVAPNNADKWWKHMAQRYDNGTCHHMEPRATLQKYRNPLLDRIDPQTALAPTLRPNSHSETTLDSALTIYGDRIQYIGCSNS
ncbi:hypothetical protein N7534_003743 [Penicillium rubens]|nr:hypothetical protein N7534_003743 [Penicillium rubens]